MQKSTFIDEIARITRATSADALAVDEAFWARLAGEYDRDERFIQLNYGYYHPSLRPVLEVEIEAAREINRRGSHFKWKESTNLLEAARSDLARMAGADAEEIVITRNASEALNIVIQGIALEPGDEVVCSDQDYTAMDQAWEQRARNEGIRLRRVTLPLDPGDDGEILRLFEAEITARTRLIHVTHMIHLTGQILPAEKLCALGRQRGIAVLVDAAHSFAQIDFSIRALDCDYLGASLHKWLGAPLGTGLLYVRADRISSLRPLFGDTHYPVDNIRRLERFGNRPDSAHAGIREAVRWHLALGTAVKQARLAHLHRTWAETLRSWPRFRVLTPQAAGRYGAIGLLSLDGAPAEALVDYLLEEHKIFTVAMKLRSETAVRVTPGLPTSRAHIDRLLGRCRRPPGISTRVPLFWCRGLRRIVGLGPVLGVRRAHFLAVDFAVMVLVQLQQRLGCPSNFLGGKLAVAVGVERGHQGMVRRTFLSVTGAPVWGWPVSWHRGGGLGQGGRASQGHQSCYGEEDFSHGRDRPTCPTPARGSGRKAGKIG